MLNFIIGRNNSGKTEKIRALIAERASENKKCILIVPEQFSFESERSILEKIGAQKMLNVDILSFTRLAFVINEQYGKALNKTIDDGTRKVLMSIHIMRGIPRQAVHRNTRIYGTTARARDIASQFSLCPWNTDMYGVDTEKRGAEEYYDSLFKLYASWGVDFVKVDDIANTEFSPQNPYSAEKEIEMIRAAIDRSGRDMVLSLSPGPAPLNKADHLSENANMWRISGDFWDRWDKLLNMFSLCEKWYPYVKDGSFPDCDILPLGKLCIDGSYMGDMGRDSGFTKEEQKTMMTLWAVFRSPLFFGGELRLTDNYTLSLVTNPEVINVNQNSEKPLFVYNKGGIAVWQTKIENCTAVAVFNLSDEEKHYKLSFSDLGIENVRAVRDLWARKDIPKCENDVTVSLKPHSSEFFEIY